MRCIWPVTPRETELNLDLYRIPAIVVAAHVHLWRQICVVEGLIILRVYFWHSIHPSSGIRGEKGGQNGTKRIDAFAI